MEETTYNPFRQVALTLISLTIIVLGIVYNQATEKSEAEVNAPMGAGTQQTITPTPSSPQTTAPTTPPSTTITPQPTTTPNVPKVGPIMLSLDELDLSLDQFEISPTINLSTALENLAFSLNTIRQFAISPREIAFASDGLDLGLPGIGGAESIAVMPEITPDIAPPTTAGVITPPAQPALWKILTGYNQLENLTNTLSAIQTRNAGTGKCMIEVAGIGCIVNW